MALDDHTNGSIAPSKAIDDTSTDGEGAHPGDTHDIPAPEPHSSFQSLKDRIALHYNLASDYYYTLWGQHIHHGLFRPSTLSKEAAQENLIDFMLDMSSLSESSAVLDVGCGLGGTSRYLAREKGCAVMGVTISKRQVEIANRLSRAESSHHEQQRESTQVAASNVPVSIGEKGGNVIFHELDAEAMLPFFRPDGENTGRTFDCVWISEALSHIPNKEAFFSNSHSLLRPGGKLVIADWFKSFDLTSSQVRDTIKPIEDGMLLPRLYTMNEYVSLATDAGLELKTGPEDISKDVAKTWDISWALISSPSLWAFAISQGRDGLAFLQAFRAMRRGYADGSFRYGVLVFEKGKP
jgi:tocopherol O-methyltransferase